MNSNNSLALVKGEQAMGRIEKLNVAEELDLFKLADVFAQSGLFSNARDMAKAAVQILAGREMNIGAFAAMSGIHIVNGKCVVGATIIASAIKQSGKYTYRILQQTTTVCEIEVFERITGYDYKPIGKSIFTIEDARGMGLLTKDNWKKFPADMLFARAISRVAKHHCPDIFNGTAVYTPGEIEETPETVPLIKADPVKQAEPKTIANVARETSPLMNEASFVEPEERMRKNALLERVRGLCKRLATAGDDSVSSPKRLNEFVARNFDGIASAEALDVKTELPNLIVLLEEQLSIVLEDTNPAIADSPDVVTPEHDEEITAF